MENSFIETASEILAKLPIFSQSQQSLVRELGRFYADWKNIVGERYYSHSRPLDIKNGILIIEAEHSGWINLMQFQSGNIQKKINAKFPKLRITGIAYRLYNQTEPETGRRNQEVKEEPVNPELSSPKELHEILDTIKDDNFRNLMEHVAMNLLKSCNTGEQK